MMTGAWVLAGCGDILGLGDIPRLSVSGIEAGPALIDGTIRETTDGAGEVGSDSFAPLERSEEVGGETEGEVAADGATGDAGNGADATDDAADSGLDRQADGPIDAPFDQGSADWLGTGLSEEVFTEVDFHGGMLLGGPTVASWGVGRLDVLAVGLDGALYHTSFETSSGWQNGWDALGGSLTSDPAAASFGTGRIDAFGRGADYGIWHISRDPSYSGDGWSTWQDLGGNFASAPASSSWGAGRLDIFAMGSDNALYHKWYDPQGEGQGWSGPTGQPGDPAGWYPLGGSLTSAPGAASWAPGQIDVFALGPDHSLQHGSQAATSGMWSWDPTGLGGSFTTRPAVSSQGIGLLDVFVVGPASTPASTSVYHRSYDALAGGWSDWLHVSDSATPNAPASVSWGPGRVDFFTIGAESSCQKAADFYGISQPTTWGFAPTDVQAWWNQSACSATSTTPTSQLCQNASDLYAIVGSTSFGGADDQAKAWWTSTGCSTTPSCQDVSDLFGLSAGPTGYAPGYVANWWLNAATCTTMPLFAPASQGSNCQRASDRFGIIAGQVGAPTDFGFAPTYVQTWWNSAQSPACNTMPGDYVLKHFGKGS
jgi:hypothetical protein